MEQNKVVLSKEQAEAIEFAKEFRVWDFDDFMEHYPNYKGKHVAALKTVTRKRLAYALLNGYEIEQPKLKVGDWAFWNDTRGIAKTPFILQDASKGNFFPDIWPSPYCGGESLKPSELRFATPEEIKTEKERRFWAELGREIGELKPRDGIRLISGESYTIGVSISVVDADDHFTAGKITGFYPAESFKRFPKDGDSE